MERGWRGEDYERGTKQDMVDMFENTIKIMEIRMVSSD